MLIAREAMSNHSVAVCRPTQILRMTQRIRGNRRSPVHIPVEDPAAQRRARREQRFGRECCRLYASRVAVLYGESCTVSASVPLFAVSMIRLRAAVTVDFS